MIVNGEPDPIQKKLRTDKKEWNRDVSDFIDDLIHFKKMMNGQPSKFFKERGSIKEPIPANPISILDRLMSSFHEISQEGTNIAQHQLDYSKNRKKSQPKSAPSVNTGIDLSKQLNAAMDVYDLVAEGSNPLSRFLTKLVNPTLGSSPKARTKKYRMSLLNAALEIYKDLDLLQKTILKSSPESIFEANKLFLKIENNWLFFKSGLKTYRGNDNKSVSNTQKVLFSDPRVEEIIKDYQDNAKDLSVTRKTKLISNIIQYRKIIGNNKVSNFSKLNEIIDSIINEYDKILFELNTKYGLQDKSLGDIWKKVKLDKEKKDAPDLPSKESLPEVKTNVSINPITEVIGILKDYKYLVNFTGIDIKKMTSLLGEFRLNKDAALIPKIIEEYNKLIYDLNMKYGLNGTSFQNIWEMKKANADEKVDSLVVLSQKWLGKLKHQILTSKTSAQRLDIYKAVESCRIKINDIMDSLEKELNLEFLEKLIIEVDKFLKETKNLISGIESTLHGKDFDDPNLDKYQRDRLKKTIEQRRLRELSNLYEGKGK